MTNKPKETIYKNAKIFDRQAAKFILTDVVVSNGVIADITNTSSISGGDTIDLGGKILLKTFCDNHLHMPGTDLYDLFGINIFSCSAVAEYASAIKSKEKNAGIIRGFGWDAEVVNAYFAKNKDVLPLEFLDNICADKPVILFSNDFHSCWCNTRAVELIDKFEIKYVDSDGGGIFHEHVAKEIFNVAELSFSEAEIRTAVLSYQQKLLGYGITEVFAFMFIGAPRQMFLRVLGDLDAEKKLKIKVHCCYDVFQGMSEAEITQDIEASGKYKSARVDFVFAKIYIDGVIENYSAWLEEPYADKDTSGYCLWEHEKLLRMIDFLHSKNIPVHAHAIGDRAVREVVECIGQAKKIPRGDTVTHIQLCSQKTIRGMTQNNTAACLQPFWLFDAANEKGVEQKRLGSRANKAYPINDIVKNGCKLLFASDNPVTINFNPIIGIKTACMALKVKKSNALVPALDAYTNNAYFGSDCQIRTNEPADLVCFPAQTLDELLENTPKPEFVLIDGEKAVI